jgi:hypothetical protein
MPDDVSCQMSWEEHDIMIYQKNKDWLQRLLKT